MFLISGIIIFAQKYKLFPRHPVEELNCKTVFDYNNLRGCREVLLSQYESRQWRLQFGENDIPPQNDTLPLAPLHQCKGNEYNYFSVNIRRFQTGVRLLLQSTGQYQIEVSKIYTCPQ